jgi:hypothetical protein
MRGFVGKETLCAMDGMSTEVMDLMPVVMDVLDAHPQGL